MDKGNCTNCGRRIQKTTTDSYMYCGAELELEQRFNQEEKQAILAAEKNLDEEFKAKDQADDSVGIGAAFFDVGDVGGGSDC